MPAAMNAANEIAVEAFLNRGIRFTVEIVAGSYPELRWTPIQHQNIEPSEDA